jgi:V8-like Glu-specific endopeptidase
MNTTHTPRTTTPLRLAPVALALATAMLALPAQAQSAERIESTPYGEVATVDAPASTRGRTPMRTPFQTREERARVQPLSWHDRDAVRAVETPLETEAEAMDRGVDRGLAGGGAPEPGAAAMAREHFAEDWDYLEALDAMIAEGELDPAAMEQPLGTAGVFTRYTGNLHTQFWQYAPFNKIGKLYFTTPSGGSSYCTANLISGNNHIVTAAHCIYTRGQGFNRNFVFVPADRYGAAPYGSYGWTSARVPVEWINQGGRRWDVGVVSLANHPQTGLPASAYVGWLGTSWNHGYVQNMHSVGYASNLSTQYTHVCSAESFYAANEGIDVLVKGCDMTFGSSGGGWLRNFLPYSHGGNHVNGVVSGPHIGHFGTTYNGPRFSSQNFLPLCNAAGC